MAQRIADPRARHAIGLREGAHPDHMRVLHVDRRHGAGGGKFAIGLVQAQHRTFGQRGDHLLHPLGAVPAAHRVVGIAEIDQRRVDLGRLGEQRVGVFGIVPVGNGVQFAAIAPDVIVESRIGPGRCHHRSPLRHQQPHQRAQQRVDPRPDHQVLARHAVMRGQCLAQIMALGIAVFPDLRCLGLHRLDGLRCRPEDALVGPDSRPERAA